MFKLNDAETQTFCQKLYAKSCDVLEETAEYAASWSIGQTILKQTDRCLWTLEKCAEWSLPSAQVPKENGTKDTFGNRTPLVRPVPWILFLPLLVLLRVMRTCTNMAAHLIGIEPVKPAGIIKFIQVRRRRVRAIKFMGLRRMRQRKLSQQLNALSAPTWQRKINNILNGLMCFKTVRNDISVPITSNDLSEEEANTTGNCNLNVKRKYVELLQWEDVSDEEELLEKIDKLTREGNGTDPDFMPVEEETQSEEESSSSEAEDNAPTSEALERHTSRNSVTNESIEEENEESDSTAVSDDECVMSKESPSNLSDLKYHETNSNKITRNSLECQGELNVDEFYSPHNSISVTPEPAKDLEDSAQCKSNGSPQISPSKSNDKQETANFIQAEKNEENSKTNESISNSPRNKPETSIANEKSPQTNSTNNHNEHGE